MRYLKKMAPMKLILEMEIGITGGIDIRDHESSMRNLKSPACFRPDFTVRSTAPPARPHDRAPLETQRDANRWIQ